MLYTTLFVDLDDTLYPNGNGLWLAIRERMNLYMIERLGLPAEDVPGMRARYYKQYGTTLRGLQEHFKVDADDYLAYVHDIPLEKFLMPAPELRKMINSLPQRRWIFTNADRDHADRVLAVLGLGDCFEGIIDVRAMEFACKPEKAAYQRALHLAGNPPAGKCVMLDDNPDNLLSAAAFGFCTVLVGNHRRDGANSTTHWVPDLLALPDVMPELWRNGGEISRPGKPWMAGSLEVN